MHPSERRLSDLLSVAVDDRGTTRTISPTGEIDIGSAILVAGPLDEGLADGFETVVVDLGRTTFIDSTGIRVLLHATRRAGERQTRLVVLPGPADVQRVFELCGLADVIPFVHDGARRNGA